MKKNPVRPVFAYRFVCIIASTNQNLEEKIKRGEYRDDFFYRLNVLPIKLPPLIEHPEDIPIIANHLLEKHCAKLNKPLKKISPELMEVFVKRNWEGNVRELENVIMQGILFSTADEIQSQNIDLAKRNPTEFPGETALKNLPYKKAKEKTLVRFNQEYLWGNVSRAARQCGLERQALQQIMRRYDIRAERYRV